MMRLDVYRRDGRDGAGYVVDVQSGLVDHLKTRVVVPLVTERTYSVRIRGMNPVFDIHGEQSALLTQFLSSVSAAVLRRPVASLSGHRDEVTWALDTLLIGF